MPDDEAKNEVGVEVALLPSTSSLLALFVDKYRPHLLKASIQIGCFPANVEIRSAEIHWAARCPHV